MGGVAIDKEPSRYFVHLISHTSFSSATSDRGALSGVTKIWNWNFQNGSIKYGIRPKTMEYARGVGGAKHYGILEHHGLKCGTSTENYGIRW